MKMLALRICLLSFMSLVAGSAFAGELAWQDMRVGDAVVLTQDIELAKKDGSVVELIREEGMRLLDLEGMGGGLSLVKATFALVSCEDPALETEMMLVLPKRGAENAEVGVQIALDCRLEIYIETKDYGTPSFFQSARQ
jgi:hypothetical protein